MGVQQVLTFDEEDPVIFVFGCTRSLPACEAHLRLHPVLADLLPQRPGPVRVLDPSRPCVT